MKHTDRRRTGAIRAPLGPLLPTLLLLTLLFPVFLTSAGRGEGVPTAPSLAASLGDPDVRVRRFAAWRLGEFGADGEAALSPLIGALRAEDFLVRRYAGESLARLGAISVAPLAEELRRDHRTRRAAESALIAIGASAVPALIEILEASADDRARGAAARALGEIGPPAAAAAPALVASIERENARAVGVSLASALGGIGPAALGPLLEMFARDPGPLARELAYRALERIGPAGREALPHLREATLHAESHVRSHAIQALGAIAPGESQSLLRERLHSDSSATVRAQAARVLGRADPPEAETVSALVGTFTTGDPRVAATAGMALGALGESALDSVLVALGHADENVRSRAALSLRYFDSHPGRAVPFLVEALADSATSVRREAAITLERYGPGTVPELVEALRERPEDQVRTYSAMTLGKLEPPPFVAIPALIEALSDDASTVRQMAGWALGRMGPKSRAATPSLIVALGDEDAIVRRNAVWALGNIGTQADSAAPAVVPLLSDEDLAVREEAAEALEKIRGDYVYRSEEETAE